MVNIIAATESDIPEIVICIRGLAEYQKLADQVTATEERLREALFGPRPVAEVLMAFCGSECAGIALFCNTYSSMLARPGIYLDDLFVKPRWRGKGVGCALLQRLAFVARERQCARLEWMVLDWNRSAVDFYRKRGAALMEDWTKCRVNEEGIQKLQSGERA